MLKRQPFIPTVVTLILALHLLGCSSVPLAEADADELVVNVTLQQDTQQTRLDVFLMRGIWRQPVSAEPNSLTLMFADGLEQPLKAANKKGQYGVITSHESTATTLALGPLPAVHFPPLQPVHITGKDSFNGQLFFRDDTLNLALPASHGQQRYLVSTGYCGTAPYRTALAISPEPHTLKIKLDSVMARINAAAEADLNGIIPVQFAIEEHYQADWPSPFAKVELIARDSADILIDTSGFRFKADVRLQLSSNLMIRLQNQAWPSRYCY